MDTNHAARWSILMCPLLALILGACGSLERADSAREAGRASTLSAPPATEAPLQTGVHLQALFEVPERVIGGRASQEQMRYLLWLPEGYWREPDRRWPLIFFLHGSGDEDFDSGFVMSYGLPEVLHKGEQPEEFPFLVVSPQAFPGTAWWEGDTLAVLDLLVEEVLANYRVDQQRVYLTGLSMGGYGSWHLATAYPDHFAAMVSVSGSGYRTPAVPGDQVLCRMEEIAVWAIHGVRDQISAVEASKFFTSALEVSCEGEVKWTQYEDAGHFEAYARAYRDPALYAWMLGHARE